MTKQQSRELLTNTNFSEEYKTREEFEYVEFTNCFFSELSNLKFRDCVFKNCNLSNLKTNQAVFQNCEFKDCKLLGVNFGNARDFGFEVYFENCNLDYTSFDKKKITGGAFKNCRLHGANFTQADLSKCKFVSCDFFEALFSGTNLSGIDFTTCSNFLIDPELNKIKKAKFSLQSLPSLLFRHEIVIEN